MANEQLAGFDSGSFPPLLVALCSGLLLFIFFIAFCTAVCCFCKPKPPQPTRWRFGAEMQEITAASNNMGTSSGGQLIQDGLKYENGVDMVRVGDGSTCAICLGDFEEGDYLRTLPGCTHSFHIPCIDKWLYSHLSCPTCRAHASPLMTGI